jgi:hypothetical protein
MCEPPGGKLKKIDDVGTGVDKRDDCGPFSKKYVYNSFSCPSVNSSRFAFL